MPCELLTVSLLLSVSISLSITNGLRCISAGIGIENRIILAVRIEVQPIAAVGILLGKAGDDRIVEACMQVILLRDRVKLLAGELETVGDGFLLGRKVAPGSGAL